MKKVLMTLILVTFMICLFVITKVSFYKPVNEVDKIKKMNLDKADNLMIVAHPDDETLWGASELIHNNYLVVCITCGTSEIRLNEIKEVLEMTHDNLISLGYPDKIMGLRSEWSDEEQSIESDLKSIIEEKEWKKIITHNAKGEYGHIQHKNTNKIVSRISPKNLTFFGKYYRSKDIKNAPDLKEHRLDEETLKIKRKMLDLYVSQRDTINKFSHIIPYENLSS